MHRVCSICRHEKADEINAALLRNDSFRRVAKRFGTSPTALVRHKKSHIAETLAKAKDAAEALQATELLQSMQALHIRTLKILKQAELAGRWDIALKAIKEARCNLELLGKLDGQLKDREGGETHITVTYVDKQLIMPASTAAKCIEGAGKTLPAISGERTKGEAPPFDDSKS